jgi:hypothetical protein
VCGKSCSVFASFCSVVSGLTFELLKDCIVAASTALTRQVYPVQEMIDNCKKSSFDDMSRRLKRMH